MKLSKLFHSLYTMVMFLPVFIIPIFALNILHKETEPISIEVQENVYTESNYVETYVDLKVNNIYFWEDTLNTGEITEYVTFGIMQDISYFKTQFPQYEELDITRVRLYLDSNLSVYNEISVRGQSSIYQNVVGTPFNFIVINLQNEQNIPNGILQHIKYSNVKYFLGFQTVIYNSTDIGSQFVYALYKPVNDYFNYSQYFGLSGMYDWFQMNFFNGTAPLTFFIFFNLLVYWLIISLFWLIFDILIYVPMMVHRWLDKAAL